MVKVSEPTMLERAWGLFDRNFPDAQKMFIMPASLKGTVEYEAALAGWKHTIATI
jgi:hypothetical protein